MGHHDTLGPPGVEVADDALIAKRSRHPVDMGTDAGMDNIVVVRPDFFQKNPWLIDFAGEPLSVEWML